MNDLPREPRRPVHARTAWLLLGALILASAAGIVALRWWQSDPIPPLTPKLFYEARAKWETAGPEDYDIEVIVSGSQPATYEVQVRKGQAEVALRNGQPLRQRRTFGTWSVPGMFSTMLRDVQAVELASSRNPDPALPKLTLRAQFDPQYGYPARYRRIQQGSTVEVSWQVTKFEVKGSK
jgi:hypothetical protein